jgi:hypothetical protein
MKANNKPVKRQRTQKIPAAPAAIEEDDFGLGEAPDSTSGTAAAPEHLEVDFGDPAVTASFDAFLDNNPLPPEGTNDTLAPELPSSELEDFFDTPPTADDLAAASSLALPPWEELVDFDPTLLMWSEEFLAGLPA